MKTKNSILIYALGLFFLLAVSGCKKPAAPAPAPTKVATLTTTINSITESSAICTANIENTGGASITEKGFCWSTHLNPTVDDNKMITANDSLTFHDTIQGLISNTPYYVRAYAINEKGIAYGDEQTFTLWLNVPGPDVTDIDGNNYTSVKIGSQIWMVENLKTTRYSNGELIGTTNPATLFVPSIPSSLYQWAYNGEESNVASYGRLYSWYAVTDSRNIAPKGWHVPTADEWMELINYLGGESVAGGKLKATGSSYWESPNVGASNASGFTTLSGGYRELDGSFQGLGHVTYFWMSTISGGRDAVGIFSGGEGAGLTGGGSKSDGFYVRCVKDN
ncbi:MAG: fibrobacter succinogenes major paralogous domain-containing protein [Bacteroidales bacterium]|nr:fibrobacter succinogenes major paralogous domain-containing protein [Bacteroidales bacterium]